MTKKSYKFKAKLWLYPGESGNWRFITVPKKESKAIREKNGALARGFGSLPVRVTIRKTSWTTSIFPDSKSGTYILPIKASVRKEEGLFEGDVCTIEFSVEV